VSNKSNSEDMEVGQFSELVLGTRLRRKAYFDIWNCLGVTKKCDGQTDRRTDSLIACAALQYVARPKNYEFLITNNL